MATFLWSALLAALTALTFVAYRHPRGYWRIFIALGSAIILADLAAFFDALGSYNTLFAVKDFIIPGRLDEAVAATKATIPPEWGMLLGIAVSIYLILLGFLPKILNLSDKGDD